jgi:hypothetical protein
MKPCGARAASAERRQGAAAARGVTRLHLRSRALSRALRPRRAAQ